ncbi:hypothetical protein D3C86_1830860 [compost metagenome]
MFWLKVSFSSWRRVEKMVEVSSNARGRDRLAGAFDSTLDNRLTPEACKCRYARSNSWLRTMRF